MFITYSLSSYQFATKYQRQYTSLPRLLCDTTSTLHRSVAHQLHMYETKGIKWPTLP